MGFEDELFPEDGLAIRRKYSDNGNGKLEILTVYSISKIDEKDLTKMEDERDLNKGLEQYKR